MLCALAAFLSGACDNGNQVKLPVTRNFECDVLVSTLKADGVYLPD